MRAISSLIITTALLGAGARAQCAQWQPGQSVPGIDGVCTAMLTADPGGLGSRVFVAGSFRAVGDVRASNLAALDPVTGTWTSVGGGTDGAIADLDVLPNGDLLIAGGFSRAGNVNAPNLAVWNGTQWSTLGSQATSGLAGVSDIAVSSTGRVGAAGPFGLAVDDGVSVTQLSGSVQGPTGQVLVQSLSAIAADPGVPDRFFVAYSTALGAGVARVDLSNPGSGWTSSWASVGFTTPEAATSLDFAGADLVAGGGFSTLANSLGGTTGTTVNFIALFNTGTSVWSSLQAGGPPPFQIGASAPVESVVALGANDVLVGGPFASIAGTTAAGAARITGFGIPPTIDNFGGGVTGTASCGAVLPGGELLVGGRFDRAGTGAAAIAVSSLATRQNNAWQVTTGSNLGLFAAPFGLLNSEPQVFAVQPFAGGVAVGGRFGTAAGAIAPNLAFFDPATSTWTPLAGGTDGDVNALAVDRGGDLIVGGAFTGTGGVGRPGVARWDGTAWQSLGTGVIGTVEAVLVTNDAAGVVVGGTLMMAGGVPVSGVAQFDGTTWSTIGAGLPGTVFALAQLPNGNIVAGGMLPSVSNLGEWNGSSWRPLGATGANGIVRALLVRPNGDLVVGGSFSTIGTLTNANSLAVWDGTAFVGQGGGVTANGQPGVVRSLSEAVDGDLIVGGAFTSAGSIGTTSIARFDGSTWSAIQRGVDANVSATAFIDEQRLAVGGDFSSAGGIIAARFVVAASTCPATAVPFTNSVTGCQPLTADNLPMIGTTFQATATNLPTPSLVLSVRGLSQVNIPLTVPFPGVPTSCASLASSDLIDVSFTTTSSTQTGFAIVNSTTLIGQSLEYQVVALEVDSALNVLSTTATNGLTLTFGSF